MTRESIIDFIQQCQHMMQQLGQIQKNINEGKAIKEFLETQGQTEKALQVGKELSDVRQSYELASQVLMRKCKRDTVSACETLLADVIERIKLVDASYDKWRALLAEHELETQLNPALEPRQARQEQITVTQKRFEVALQIAGDAVPAMGVVLL